MKSKMKWMRSPKQLFISVGLLIGLVLPNSLLWTPLANSQEAMKPLSPRFSPDPQVYSGTTSGSTSLQSLAGLTQVNGACQGMANQTANYVLVTEKPFGFLSLKVIASGKATLLVKGPDGIYCRDSSKPSLEGTWAAGRYEIWVGSQTGESIPFQLSISETSQ
ncbi:hypothetical protein V2H45_07130 [Tumidithrix elongata RA019]|uniref:Uncharacterized protein n=1 Tax=Tumidithrix elongata BACA0141 TaxID=2716417 RepID=A0AAW9PZZ7_9CYAN|nr:hypothetical protein [Tumidithrix elongata RA019]